MAGSPAAEGGDEAGRGRRGASARRCSDPGASVMKVKKEGSKSEALPREMEMKMKDDKEKGREDEPLTVS